MAQRLPPASVRDLKLGLFMPCYIDLVYPKVGIATLELLERLGLNVEYPLNGPRRPRRSLVECVFYRISRPGQQLVRVAAPAV